ncbi:pyridoxamine 5'-phosphate oxidase family protein [Aegicerativicinus sediminis]
MGKRLDHIAPKLQEFINEQKVFFVATAMAEGNINLSPKGLDTFRIINKNEVVWLNLTGSGNETATHLLHKDRMTIMFCAFEGKPLILRLYGTAKAFNENHEEFHSYSQMFPQIPGTRQFVRMKVNLVQTSCGFGVPLMDFKSEREVLTDFATIKGQQGIRQYWKDKNTVSLDGHSTDINP